MQSIHHTNLLRDNKSLMLLLFNVWIKTAAFIKNDQNQALKYPERYTVQLNETSNICYVSAPNSQEYEGQRVLVSFIAAPALQMFNLPGRDETKTSLLQQQYLVNGNDYRKDAVMNDNSIQVLFNLCLNLKCHKNTTKGCRFVSYMHNF